MTFVLAWGFATAVWYSIIRPRNLQHGPIPCVFGAAGYGFVTTVVLYIFLRGLNSP